jgi:polygalacturonase
MRICLLLIVLITAGLALAQDSRKVTEPVFPPACITLEARISQSSVQETQLDTQRIQNALDHCGAGKAVLLKASGTQDVFLSGPLELRAGVTLLVDKGAGLLASRNPRDYDLKPGSCGVVNQEGHGCKALLSGAGISGAGVMGDGWIDGRGGAKLTGQNVSWWDLAQQAKVTNLNQSCPRILQLVNANDFTLYRITLRNSPNFHVSYAGGRGFTAWGVVIDAPKTSRNTDGIDPSSATDVTIVHSFIRAGDDNVAIKAGAAGPSSHMTIEHNHFYSGHGMSIGSETDGGASFIRVSDLSIDGADNGLRIKSNSSRGGLVHDVLYQDVCIRDTKNPVLMDTHYSFRGSAEDKIPEFRNITLRNVAIFGPGVVTLDGFDALHPLGMIFDGVAHDGGALNVKAQHLRANIATGGSNLRLSGTDVEVTGSSDTVALPSCAERFVPFSASTARR